MEDKYEQTKNSFSAHLSTGVRTLSGLLKHIRVTSIKLRACQVRVRLVRGSLPAEPTAV